MQPRTGHWTDDDHHAEERLTRQEVVDIRRPNSGPFRVNWPLPPDFGWVSVSSIPTGLPVTVNGEVLGITPISGLELSPAAYDVRIIHPQYHEAGERLVLARGERRTLTIAPDPRRAPFE